MPEAAWIRGLKRVFGTSTLDYPILVSRNKSKDGAVSEISFSGSFDYGQIDSSPFLYSPAGAEVVAN